MNKLNVGDVICSRDFDATGLKAGREFKVVKVNGYNFESGEFNYDLEGGYGLDHKWLVKGYVVKVEKPRLPSFETGTIVRIKKSKYTSIKDFGKRGIIVRKHWGPTGVEGREMYGVYVEGDATTDWSYANDELEAI